MGTYDLFGGENSLNWFYNQYFLNYQTKCLSTCFKRIIFVWAVALYVEDLFVPEEYMDGLQLSIYPPVDEYLSNRNFTT